MSAAASVQLSAVELELSKIRRSMTSGIESPAAAALRRKEEEKVMKRDTWIGSIIASFSSTFYSFSL